MPDTNTPIHHDARPAPGRRGLERTARARPDRPVVLLVDDVADNLLALEAMLRRDDVQILGATSGRDALELLLEHDVAVAIIDVMMPEMDGFELADLIRGVDRTRHVPIIFVTAGARAEYRVFTGYETGAIDFLYKPLDERVLRAKVDVLVTLERQRAEVERAREDAERARRETSVLLRLAQATSQCERPEEVHEPALDAVRDLLGAERSAILFFDQQDRMRFRAWRGLSDAYRTAVDGHSPWSRQERDARPIFVPDVTRDESLATLRPVLEAERIRAVAFVPLVSDHRLLGKFMLYWEEPRVFSEGDRTLAVAVAAEIADAVSRVRLREAERSALLRVARLQRVTASLNEVLTPEGVARACLPAVVEAIGGTAGMLHLLAADGSWLEAVDHLGVSPELAERVRRIGMESALPAVEAIRSRRPVFVESREVYATRYPEMADTTSRHGARAALPLIVQERVIGVLGVSLAEWGTFSEEDRAFLEACANQCAQAFDRARAHEALRLAEERLRVALSAGRMGVWEWSVPTGRVRWSPTLEAIHGLAPGTFEGTFEAFQRDVHPEDLEPLLRTLRETLEAGREHHVEYRIVLPDGEVRWVAGHGNVVETNGEQPARMMGVCMDITDRKENERAREAAAAELAETLRVNEVFAGILAHDLRNPLGAILGAAQLLQLPGAEAGGDRRANALRRIVSSGERMARMIDQLLDFTRARVGGAIELQVRRVDLGALCRQVLGELELSHPDWRVGVEALGDLSGTWDPDRLLQVVSNLVTNAGQHGVPGERIQIKLDGTDPDAVSIEVHNQGSIPEELLPTLFEPFRATRARGSTGLGLGVFITREIVRAHGGGVDVRSSPESGTTFRAVLPRRAPAS